MGLKMGPKMRPRPRPVLSAILRLKMGLNFFSLYNPPSAPFPSLASSRLQQLYALSYPVTQIALFSFFSFFMFFSFRFPPSFFFIYLFFLFFLKFFFWWENEGRREIKKHSTGEKAIRKIILKKRKNWSKIYFV